MTQHRTLTPVLVGVDGSASSLAAVELGAWEAKRRRAPLLLVHGYQGEVPQLAYGWVPTASLGTSMRDAARELLAGVEVATHAAHPGLSVRSTVIAGGGASALVELSRNASLVLVGSRGHGGFADLLLGSVAAQVASHAHAPVIVVRPPVDDPASRGAARLSRTSGPVVVGIDGSRQRRGASVRARGSGGTPPIVRHLCLVRRAGRQSPPWRAVRPGARAGSGR
jgi:nucleotide-binding universal stress UspA family protein